MQDAVPEGKGAMLAVMGVKSDELEDISKKWKRQRTLRNSK